MLLRNYVFHILDTIITQPVLGKFPIKVKISIIISNSVLSAGNTESAEVEVWKEEAERRQYLGGESLVQFTL
jgi:hypothetical protein